VKQEKFFFKVAFALPILDNKAVPNFYDNCVNFLTDLKNTFYEWKIASLSPFTRLEYCQTQSSKRPPLSVVLCGCEKTRSPSTALSTALEGRAKCPTVPQLRQLKTGTLGAGQGSK